jgi:DNA-binding NarL/FixJ family response regulator
MLGRLRVLIVDDHPSVVRAVSRLLSFDYDVVGTLSHANGMLEAARTLHAEVILLDVNLPDIDGLTACRQVIRALPDIKVVVFTAADDPNTKRRAFEAGACAVVDKVEFGGELLSTLKGLDAARN